MCSEDSTVFFFFFFFFCIFIFCIAFCWSDSIFLFVSSFIDDLYCAHIIYVFKLLVFPNYINILNVEPNFKAKTKCELNTKKNQDRHWINWHIATQSEIVKNGCILIRFTGEFSLKTFNLDFIFQTISNFVVLCTLFGFILYLSVCVFVGLSTFLCVIFFATMCCHHPIIVVSHSITIFELSCTFKRISSNKVFIWFVHSEMVILAFVDIRRVTMWICEFVNSSTSYGYCDCIFLHLYTVIALFFLSLHPFIIAI